MINLDYKLNQQGGNDNNIINIISRCNNIPNQQSSEDGDQDSMQIIQDQQNFLDNTFTIYSYGQVGLDIIRLPIPFYGMAQAPSFHPYHSFNTSMNTFKIPISFYDNIPDNIKGIVNGKIDQNNIDLFFTINYLNLASEFKISLFRPQYYYLPTEDGRIGGIGERVEMTPFAGLFNASKTIQSPTNFINNFSQINGLSAHDDKISSNTHPIYTNESTQQLDLPLSVWSIVNDINGGWTKCAITLHWIIDWELAKDIRELSKRYNSFNQLIPQLNSNPIYNDLIPSIKNFLGLI
jgi:hypothetical protein